MNKDKLAEITQKAIQLESERPYTVEYDLDETTDGQKVFLLSHPELPACMAQGHTIDEALSELKDVTIECLSYLLENNLPIPEVMIPPVERDTTTASTTSLDADVVEIFVQGTEDFLDVLSRTAQPLKRKRLGVVSIVC